MLEEALRPVRVDRRADESALGARPHVGPRRAPARRHDAGVVRPRHAGDGRRGTQRSSQRGSRSRPSTGAISHLVRPPGTTRRPTGPWASASSTTSRSQSGTPRPSSGSSASPSSTGTRTTATARRRSSGTTRASSTCPCTSGPSIRGTGGPEEQTETTLNIPLPGGAGDAEFLDAFRIAVEPKLRRFDPGPAHRLRRLRRPRGRSARGFDPHRAGLRRARPALAASRRDSPPSSRAATTSRRCRTSCRRRCRNPGGKRSGRPRQAGR